MALKSLRIQGFKSIRDQTLEFGLLNVLVGGNGVGKSNLIGVFHFLGQISRQELALYTCQSGGANKILHFGRKRTKHLTIEAVFSRGYDENSYDLALRPTDADGFLFEWEATSYRDTRRYETPFDAESWSGHTEAQVAKSENNIAKYPALDTVLP